MTPSCECTLLHAMADGFLTLLPGRILEKPSFHFSLSVITPFVENFLLLNSSIEISLGLLHK
jgi:hypothetical protein